MQAPTHFLVGILIYKLFALIFPDSHGLIFITFVIISAFFSHFLVDALAFITYHVPDPRPQDKFWLGYHICIAIATIAILAIFWNPYWWAMIASILVDIIDWGIYRGILKKDAIIHPYIDKFRSCCFAWIPNLLEKKWTIINEILIISGLLAAIYAL